VRFVGGGIPDYKMCLRKLGEESGGLVSLPEFFVSKKGGNYFGKVNHTDFIPPGSKNAVYRDRGNSEGQRVCEKKKAKKFYIRLGDEGCVIVKKRGGGGRKRGDGNMIGSL